MNEIEKLFSQELSRSTFVEAVNDDNSIIDSLVDTEDDDQSAESEDM